jgi:uncharacterized protein YndB with AHSA1/START domain
MTDASVGGRQIHKSVTVHASPRAAWEAWATVAGVESFLAPKARIDLRPGGVYEPLFDLDAPEGSKGGEGLSVLAFVPGRFLAFTWNAPPEFPDVRGLGGVSWIVVAFSPRPNDRTYVELWHLGWGTGAEWDKVFEYFQHAWDVVLFRFHERFASGPVNWSKPVRPPTGWSANVPGG